MDTSPETPPPTRSGRRPHAGTAGLRLVVLLAVIVIVGVPFVAILWETLNALLAGHIEPRRLLVSVPLLVVFTGILALAGRMLGRLDSASTPRSTEVHLGE